MQVQKSDECLGEFLIKSMDLIPEDCAEDRELISKLRNILVNKTKKIIK